MIMLRTLLRLAAALLLAAAAQAAPAPSMPGEWALATKAAIAARIRLPQGAPRTDAVLPPVSPAELEMVRAANRHDGTKPRARRLAIGLDRGASGGPLATPGRLTWIAVPGGKAAQVTVTSPGAGSLRLLIDLKAAAASLEMVFFGTDRTRIEGPVRVADIGDRSVPWTAPLTEGETQTVEFFLPSGSDPASSGVRVVGAAHLFSTPSSAFAKRLQEIGDSGSCNVDLLCSPLYVQGAVRDAAASVAQMVVRDGTLTFLCTGSLVVDSDTSTQVPWLYSANHCFDNDSPPYKTPAQMQTVASTLATIWKFESDTCGSSVPNPSWSQVSGGSTLAYSNVENDGLLVRLAGTPPAGAFYTGWDANAIAGGATVISIHHPQGDLKKISQGSVLGFSTPGVGGGSETFVEVRWSSGTTEGGSSGGGIWTSSGGQYLLRGGLWGGSALCTNTMGTDNFSRFDHVYPNLVQFLGPKVTPAADYTDIWYGGDSQTGWGLNLVQHASNIVFGVWYTYEADGTRTWFVMPTGSWSDSSTYTGPLYTTTGPGYTSFFDPSQVTPRQVGTATLHFNSTSTGTFTYSVDGVSGVKSIQRQAY